MGDEVRIQSDSLRRLAGDLDEVVSLLASAQSAVMDSEISGAAFSPSGVSLAYAFAGAIEFAASDALEQAEQIGSIQARLHRTANQWDEAEDASTVRRV